MGADRCTLEGVDVPTSGSAAVDRPCPRDYVVVCENEAGRAEARVTLSVACSAVRSAFGGSIVVTAPDELETAAQQMMLGPWGGAVQGCGSVGGSVVVGPSSEITDVDALRGLTDVGGDLVVVGNDALVDLDELCLLRSVGGHVRVGRNVDRELAANPVLASVRLADLQQTGGDLVMPAAPSLSSLGGLEELRDVQRLELPVERRERDAFLRRAVRQRRPRGRGARGVLRHAPCRRGARRRRHRHLPLKAAAPFRPRAPRGIGSPWRAS